MNFKPMLATDGKPRCAWCGGSEIYEAYHDEEWGVPVYDDQALFAKLILDGAQAGLSWITILKKRDNYYRAFDNFDPKKIAKYGDKKFAQLMADAGIVRNRLKINASIVNAQAYLRIQQEEGSFSKYLWSFVGGKPIVNQRQSMTDLPATSPESDAMSRDLKKRGFKFVGSTIVYAFMQAVGMVNDHRVGCFRHREVQQ
jgi:DNA-3-methyladenine glycosylase I